MTLHDVALNGCRSDVLAHYLKALAVFRLIAGKEASARAYWRDGTPHLISSHDEEGLLHFFLGDYAPAPLVAPWNGGSGFFPKDNRTALEALEKAAAPRFEPIKRAIGAAKAALGSCKASPKDDEKLELVRRARSTWPEELLPWLDSAVTLTDDVVRYPALLGTGGNDGRLDFTNNFMQRVVGLFDSKTGQPLAGARDLLRSALFGVATSGLLRNVAIGQYLPGAAGGANATAGFDGDSLVNPWDFVLGIEGTLAFQVAAVRRLDSVARPQAAAPFALQGSGAGYASAAVTDQADEKAHGEQWMPLWSSPATWPAFERLLREGRLLSGRRSASNVLEACTAIARTGAARGLDSFERFGFIKRNGDAHFAVWLGRWTVGHRPAAELVDAVKGWIMKLRSAAEQKGAPGGFGRRVRQLETSMLALLRQEVPSRFEDVLVRMADAEDAIMRSRRWAGQQQLAPIPRLDERLLDGRLEFTEPEVELARAIAALEGRDGTTLRWNCLPLDERGHALESGGGGVRDSAEVVWSSAQLVSSLCAVLQRRLNGAAAAGGSPFNKPRFTVRPSSLARFIAGETDDLRIARLARAFMAVKWQSKAFSPEVPDRLLSPAFVACRLAFTDAGPSVADAAVARLLLRGQGEEATRAAERRLAARGLRLRFSAWDPALSIEAGRVRRMAAALLFPLSDNALSKLAVAVSRQPEAEQ